MKKILWDEKYTTIAVYSFLVLAGLFLFGTFIYTFPSTWAFAKEIVSYLIPFVYGFCIAFVLSPTLSVIENKLLPKKMFSQNKRNLGIFLTYMLFLLLLVMFFYVIIPTLTESITTIAKNIDFYIAQLDTAIDNTLSMIPEQFVPEDIANTLDSMVNTVVSFVVGILLEAATWTSRITAGILDLVMGIIVSVYMLANKEKLIAQIKKIMHALLPKSYIEKIIIVSRDSNQKFTGFIIGKAVDSLIIGIICAVSMTIFDMPFISLVSLIIGVTNIVPYFGPFIGAVPSVILVFIGAGLGPAIGFIVFILVLQQFDGNILGPAILGQSTGLDAMWVIFAILLFGGLYGVVGMIIGTPLLSVIFAVFSTAINTKLEKNGLPTEVEDYADDNHKLLTTKKGKV